MLTRSWRWQVLLRPLKPHIAFHPVWRYFNIGFAVSSLLPARLGELVRPYLLSRDQGLRFPATLATVVVERVIELSVVLALLGTGFLLPEVLGPRASDPEVATIISLIESFALVALAIALSAAVFLIVLKTHTDRALALMRFLLRPLPQRFSQKLAELVTTFADGVSGLRGARQYGELALSTVLAWLVLLLGYWVQLRAFGIDVPFYWVGFLTSVLALGVVVPTPGGSGTFHAAMMVVVGVLWGFSRDQQADVAACAIISHLIALAPILVFGVYYLMREGIDVFATAEEASEAAGEDERPS